MPDTKYFRRSSFSGPIDETGKSVHGEGEGKVSSSVKKLLDSADPFCLQNLLKEGICEDLE